MSPDRTKRRSTLRLFAVLTCYHRRKLGSEEKSMASKTLLKILEEVRTLTPDEQGQLRHALDRLLAEPETLTPEEEERR
jgi:hypothetical protein